MALLLTCVKKRVSMPHKVGNIGVLSDLETTSSEQIVFEDGYSQFLLDHTPRETGKRPESKKSRFSFFKKCNKECVPLVKQVLSNECNLLSLPDSAILAICDHLEEDDCLRLKYTCTRLAYTLTEDGWFWKTFAFRNVGMLSGSLKDELPKNLIELFAERNLIRNPSGDEGLKRWKIVTRNIAIMKNSHINPAYKWNYRSIFTSQGTQSCFVAARCPCVKYQTINLAERGLNPEFLDMCQPPIEVSDTFSTKYGANSIFTLTVMIMDAKFCMVQYFTTGPLSCPSSSAENEPSTFRTVQHVFRDYGRGARYVFFEHSGMEDMDLWRGFGVHCGAFMRDASVRVLVSQAEKKDESEICPLGELWAPPKETC